MKDPRRFYTYAYLRENRTPYYIGKGRGNRAYYKYRGTKPPKDKSRIIFLKQNLTEEEAFKHEIYMISVFGRKDLGTGILHNKTDGGEGPSGSVKSEDHKCKIRKALIGRPRPQETREKLSRAHSGKNHRNYGKSLPQETKDKIGIANSGKKRSEECKIRISRVQSDLWKITFSNGKIIITLGMRKWAKENGYHHGSISRMASGKAKKHKDIVTVEKLSQTF